MVNKMRKMKTGAEIKKMIKRLDHAAYGLKGTGYTSSEIPIAQKKMLQWVLGE